MKANTKLRISDLIWIEFNDGFLELSRKSEIRNEVHKIIIPKRMTEEQADQFIKLIYER